MPAVLLLCFALVALIAGVCHGGHGHGHELPRFTGAAAPAPVVVTGPGTEYAPDVPSHGCGHPDDGWSFDAHLPAQAPGASPSVPDAGGGGGVVVLPYDEVFPTAARTPCVRERAGPDRTPGALLIALGVDRN
ncbi:hypothetical protein [Streptomyces sp. NPDC090025]|uniref:hypothetical protein n=1 Tax=Streptomyces sp. NPDC090025 TaxID=3365922 RepID=UPI003833291C